MARSCPWAWATSSHAVVVETDFQSSQCPGHSASHGELELRSGTPDLPSIPRHPPTVEELEEGHNPYEATETEVHFVLGSSFNPGTV